MRKTFFLVACLLATGVHEIVAQEHIASASSHSRLYSGAIEPEYDARFWADNPYYGDVTSPFKGSICYHGEVYDNVSLRYDLLNQTVCVQSPVSNAYVITEARYVDWFEIDGYRFVHEPGDSTFYAAELCDGSKNGVRLYLRLWKILDSDVIENMKAFRTVLSKSRYIVVGPDGQKSFVKDGSDIAKLFPEQKDQIKTFVKQSRLNFSKSFRQGSLMKVVNSLSGQPLVAQEVAVAPTLTLQQEAERYSMALPKADGAQELVTGIPVLDESSAAVNTSTSVARTYVVPGVRKARVSIADDHELDEIVVVGGRASAVRSVTMGSEKFKPELLKNVPSAFGESDVMKIALTLPGVTSVGEASSGINVRGGSTDQNLILFNGGTVYNPSHLFGLFTSFNSDMVEDVELFKSSIPAQYGGRLSSVMTVTSKEANMKKFTGSASFGTLTSKANLEIPIVKDHLSLLVNGRTTYSDWALKFLPEKSGYKDGSANFYDFGGVLTWKLNNLHRLKVYGYVSNDRFSFSSDDGYSYTNRNISAEWRSILREGFTATLSAGTDHYDYYSDDVESEYSAARLSFAIDMLWAKLNLRQRLSDKTVLTYGLNVQHYDVQPGKYEPVGDALVIPDKLDDEKALESAVYVDCEHQVTDKFTVSAGVRYSMFNALGPRDVNYYVDSELPSADNLLETRHETGLVKTYHAPEFRLSGRYSLAENIAVKAGFNTMNQFIHKVSNSTIMSPTDIWKLSDTNIKPQSGWQMAAGIYSETANKDYEFSCEVYYKHMSDYLNYRNSAVLLMNHHLETDVLPTKGKAYGVELQVKKPFGKFNGWLSYTFARTLLRQEDNRAATLINDGNWYPSEYDRPHEIKAVLNYKFTERYSFSGNFNYATGRPTTIPAGKFYNSKLGNYLPYYTDRNSYRIPDYVRTDIAFNIEPTHKKTSFVHTSFSIGVYNAFARRNAYNVYYQYDGYKVQGYKLSVFGTAIPYVSLNMRFN